MRRVLLAIATLASLFVVGCGTSSSGDDATVKDGSGQVTNPGGKPQTEADALRAGQMRSQGEQMSAQQASQSAAMREAKERTGGK